MTELDHAVALPFKARCGNDTVPADRNASVGQAFQHDAGVDDDTVVGRHGIDPLVVDLHL